VESLRELPAHPATVAAARRLVRATCVREHLEGIRAEAVLLTSELVSAAVTQARRTTPHLLLRLRIESSADELEVAVSVPEFCTGLPDEYARALVETLSREWGLDRHLHDLGRALWFRVGTVREPEG
jgi:hypothetical protein